MPATKATPRYSIAGLELTRSERATIARRFQAAHGISYRSGQRRLQRYTTTKASETRRPTLADMRVIADVINPVLSIGDGIEPPKAVRVFETVANYITREDAFAAVKAAITESEEKDLEVIIHAAINWRAPGTLYVEEDPYTRKSVLHRASSGGQWVVRLTTAIVYP